MAVPGQARPPSRQGVLPPTPRAARRTWPPTTRLSRPVDPTEMATAEEDFQPFWQLEAAASAAQAMPSFAFHMAPTVLSPGLGLRREPLYDLPWYGKLPPWYPIPHVPREVPPFLSCSREYLGTSGEDLGHQIIGGRSESDPCCGSETFIPPPPVDASLLPDGLRTSQLLPCSPSKQSEDGPKPSNQEGTSPARFHFMEEDLHFVLYGTTPSLEHPASLQHVISGLLVPTDSSGSDSLLQTLDKGSLRLPEGLCLMWTVFGEVPHFGVFCSSFIAKGVRFGPFQGKVLNASEVKTYGDNSVMWEIFEDGHLSHFIDGKGGMGNWMSCQLCPLPQGAEPSCCAVSRAYILGELQRVPPQPRSPCVVTELGKQPSGPLKGLQKATDVKDVESVMWPGKWLQPG
ncbi:PR domain zinc finger protein 14 [Plecturocebus cupreus]